ncbi:MAG: terpene cyclase/mutase family protein [Actinobacteria bacterium]|nr:terpene cyclase/mutase family protein [Actinomycetota bacterium]
MYTFLLLTLVVFPCLTVSALDISTGLGYLKANQAQDGGFAEPGGASVAGITCRVILGVIASGQDPGSWAAAGGNPFDFLNGRAGTVSDVLDLELYVLAYSSAGRDPRNIAGIDMVSAVKSRREEGGRIGGDAYRHCMGVIALLSAGEEVPPECSEWIYDNQRSDGGWGDSEPARDTAIAVEALVALGERDSGAVEKALDYLRNNINADGGFSASGKGSDARTTSEVIMAVTAAGENPASEEWTDQGINPVDYLDSLQKDNGRISLTADTDSEPVLTTASVLPAIAGKSFPLNAAGEPGVTRVNDLGALGAGLNRGAGDTDSWLDTSATSKTESSGGEVPGRSEAGHTGNKVNQLNNMWFLVIISIAYLLVLLLSGTVVKKIMMSRQA